MTRADKTVGEDVANAAELYPAGALYVRLDRVTFARHMAVGNWAQSAAEANRASRPRSRLDARSYHFFCMPPEFCWDYPLLRVVPKSQLACCMPS